MSDAINKARRFLHEATGRNDNPKAHQRPGIVFNGPVTVNVIHLKKTPTLPYVGPPKDKSGAPAYLTHRRELLANLPPFRH